jgi:hypothetical protein
MWLSPNASSIEKRRSIERSGPDEDRKPTIRGELSSKKGCAKTSAFDKALHRSQILRDLRAMQAKAAKISGYAGNFRSFCLSKNAISDALPYSG